MGCRRRARPSSGGARYRSRDALVRIWRAILCSAARRRSNGVVRSSTRHQRSWPSCCTAGSGGGSVRTANTAWLPGASASKGLSGMRNVRTRAPSQRPAWHIAARQAATGMFSSATRRLTTPVSLNSATSWITGGTRGRPAARRPLRPRWAGVGCRSTWAQRMPELTTATPGTPAAPRAASLDRVRSTPAIPPQPAAANFLGSQWPRPGRGGPWWFGGDTVW